MKPTTDPNRIDEALQELLRLVAEGWEFRDAAWRVASRKSVQYDALVAAYDEHCAIGIPQIDRLLAKLDE